MTVKGDVTVKVLVQSGVHGVIYPAGVVVALPAGDAKWLIDRKRAEAIEPVTPTEEPARGIAPTAATPDPED